MGAANPMIYSSTSSARWHIDSQVGPHSVIKFDHSSAELAFPVVSATVSPQWWSRPVNIVED